MDVAKGQADKLLSGGKAFGAAISFAVAQSLSNSRVCHSTPKPGERFGNPVGEPEAADGAIEPLNSYLRAFRSTPIAVAASAALSKAR